MPHLKPTDFDVTKHSDYFVWKDTAERGDDTVDKKRVKSCELKKEGVEQPKISSKKHGNALSDALLMSRFNNFAADAARKINRGSQTRTSGTPPNYRKVRGAWENFPRKKNICYKLRFQVAFRLSQLIPRLFVLSLFLRMRVNNWNWKWNQKNNRHPCIRRRTCKIHKEKNQLKCQNRTWKWMAIPGVWRKSMLRVYGCVFCSISLLSVYMCVRIPWSSRSTAGVPSSRALPHFPPHTTCVS